VLGLSISMHGEDWLGLEPGRRLVFQAGPAKTLAYAAYAVEDAAELDRLRVLMAPERPTAGALPVAAVWEERGDGARF